MRVWDCCANIAGRTITTHLIANILEMGSVLFAGNLGMQVTGVGKGIKKNRKMEKEIVTMEKVERKRRRKSMK